MENPQRVDQMLKSALDQLKETLRTSEKAEEYVRRMGILSPDIEEAVKSLARSKRTAAFLALLAAAMTIGSLVSVDCSAV